MGGKSLRGRVLAQACALAMRVRLVVVPRGEVMALAAQAAELPDGDVGRAAIARFAHVWPGVARDAVARVIAAERLRRDVLAAMAVQPVGLERVDIHG